jgi:hypothetical protein
VGGGAVAGRGWGGCRWVGARPDAPGSGAKGRGEEAGAHGRVRAGEVEEQTGGRAGRGAGPGRATRPAARSGGGMRGAKQQRRAGPGSGTARTRVTTSAAMSGRGPGPAEEQAGARACRKRWNAADQGHWARGNGRARRWRPRRAGTGLGSPGPQGQRRWQRQAASAWQPATAPKKPWHRGRLAGHRAAK